jgi:Protein of unknown function (DUF1769)
MVSWVRRSENRCSSSSDSSTAMSEPPASVKSSLRKRTKFSFFRTNNENDTAIGKIEEERQEDALTSSSSEDNLINSLQNTRIVATMEASANDNHSYDTTIQADLVSMEPYGPFCASAALLQNSYLATMCGLDTRMINEEDRSNRLYKLPDDPTVEESIECVLAAQMEDEEFANLQTPSSLQQCLLKNRSISHLPPQFKRETRARSPRNIHVPQPSTPVDTTPVTSDEQGMPVKADDYPCACRSQKRPILEADRWPQRPLLMRPTPHGGTVVTGIRFAGSTDYLWKAEKSSLRWPEALHRHWKKESEYSDADENEIMCPHCMILPINNGKEMPGESLVTDFESEGFTGSILVRLKDCKGTTCPGHEQSKGYFDGVHRRYQVVVRGQFKQQIPWTECFAGFQ